MRKRMNRLAWLLSLSGGIAVVPPAGAQVTADNPAVEETVIVTGSRIRLPGLDSSSPILSIDESAIDLSSQPLVEEILRFLPATLPGDNASVNNGTDGAATVNLRGLGDQRTLVLLNGRRMVPYNYFGLVDTSTVPSAIIERIDVVTGGASAVYGSDAMAGAVNLILKNDFEGIELDTNFRQTGEGDGDTASIELTLGANLDDGAGNAVLSLGYTQRDAVMLGDRPLGRLGIETETGANYQEFLDGQPPIPAPAGCGGPNSVAEGGSTTAIPTRFAIVGGGAGTAGQFREDGSIGDNCSVFNFNPYNYYQTPLDRYNALALAQYKFNDHLEAYGQLTFTNSTVRTQIAPSGTFNSPFQLPLNNPFLTDQALDFIVTSANAARADGLVNSVPVDGTPANWIDANANGIVDVEDTLTVQLPRRTEELGARTEDFDSSQFQFTVGATGMIAGSWSYDTYFQYGESNRTTVRDGYTNLTNIQNALYAVDRDTCANGDPSCVPINLFGGFGTITPEMAAYATAIALQQQRYEQTIFNVNFSGAIDALTLPTADTGLALSVGLEHREESAELIPDECLKLSPASCQGGAGGNLLPIAGSFKLDEFFFEGIYPLFENRKYLESLSLEFGYRYTDFDYADSVNTWKAGLNWRPVDSVLVRVMQQRAVRAPNVAELFSPVTTGLDNAVLDPCSIDNVANIDATLRERCIATGQAPAQVGSVEDIISGQVNVIIGTDPNNLPTPEEADTTTAGILWLPNFSFTTNARLSLDYYDIDIKDVIGEFSAQETLDHCYARGMTDACSRIRRVGGGLTVDPAGIELYTTNLKYRQAEGLELVLDLGFDIAFGQLDVSLIANHFLTNERQSSSESDVIDCLGYYGTSCDPVAETTWLQRTSLTQDWWSVTAQWRYTSGLERQPDELDITYEPFRSIGSYSYFDLYARAEFAEHFTVRLGVDNLFDKDPPVVGGEAADTSYNSGNTLPSHYSVLGRIYSLGFNIKL